MFWIRDTYEVGSKAKYNYSYVIVRTIHDACKWHMVYHPAYRYPEQDWWSRVTTCGLT